MIWQPTYCDGYASPYNGGLLYPDLWLGCVGAWCASLGPTGGVLWDHSGFGNHGTLTNMVPGEDWVVSDGRYAVDFDGTDDYVDLGAVTSGNLSALTISGWFYRSSSSDSISLGWSDVLPERAYILVYGASNVAYWVVENGTNNFPTTSFSGTGWHHIAMTYNGSIRNGYINGVNQNVSGIAPSSYAVTGTFKIGKDLSNTIFSKGLIDDIRIYNRALNASEVAQLNQLGRGGSYAMAPRRRRSGTIATGNRRRRVLIGACA